MNYKTMFVLLFVIFVNMVFSVLFLRLNNFIHGDLYGYGLTFSYAWADEVWHYSMMVWAFLFAATALVATSFLPHYLLSKEYGRFYRWTGFLLPALAIVLQGIGIYFLNRLNNIVWGELYPYGVRYDIDWSATYNPISMPALALMVIGLIAMAVPSVKALAATKTERDKGFTPQKSHSRLGWTALTPIALRYIPRHRMRNAFTVLTVIIGVALIIGVNVTFDSVLSQFDYTTRKATGNIDIVVTSLEDTFNESFLSEVKAIDGVLSASARLSKIAKIEDTNETVTITGVDSRTDFDFMDLDLIQQLDTADSSIELGINSKEAVVPEKLNYSLSQALEMRILNQSGGLPYINETEAFEFTVVGIYQRGEREGGEGVVYVDLARAQEICDCDGKIDSIIIKITEVDLTDQIVGDLNSKLGSTYIVNPVKKDLLDSLKETTSGLSFGLQIVSILALCVSIIVVLNSMYMNVGERTREIGVLRSIGSSTRQVFWLFFSQSVLLGAVGALIGMGAGVGLTAVFKHLINFFSPEYLSPEELGTIFSANYVPYMIIGVAAGVLTTIIGGVFPSLSASRVDIIKSLRPTMRKPGKQRTALKLIGIGLPLSLFGVLEYFGAIPYVDADWGILMVSLLLPLIGVIFLTAGLLRVARPFVEHLLLLFKSNSKIISRNIDRNLLKSTACFTMIGLSLSFLIVIGGAQTGVVTGIEDVVKSYVASDLTVISEENLTRSFVENLTGLSGGTLISSATPAFIVPQETVLLNNVSDLKTTVTIIAIDPDTYPEVMSMTFSKDTPSDVFEELNSSTSLILTAPLALSLNVSVNDELKLPTVSIIEVPVTIPNPALNASTLPDLSMYNGSIPGGLAYPIDIPTTITIYVPEIQITYVNFTVIGISEGAWLRAASFSGIQLSKTCYISYNSLNETFPEYEDEASVFFAKAASSLDVKPAGDKVIELYGTEYGLEVVTREEILTDLRGDIDRIFLSLYVPVLFAALNAVIGVLSIMIMNVSTRRREIGILRSQGMSRSQVVTSIIGEVLVLGIVGFFIAVGLGLIFQSITVTFMNMAGFTMPFIVSLSSIWLAFVQAVVISVLSAAYPAYRAAKLGIVDSLRVT